MAAGKEELVRIDRVLFLGTGSAVPVPGQRNMSSCAVMLTSGAAILIDCGEGTQHHLRVSTILRAAKLEAILLTHLHGDHCYGLFGLLQSAAMEGRKDPVLLVGPEGLREMVDTVFRLSGGWNPEESFELEYVEIPNTATAGGEDLRAGGTGGFCPERCRRVGAVPLGVRLGLELQAVPLVHSVPDWGYVLTEPERPGALDAARAAALGVPKGPSLGRLKAGEAVTLPDGRVVRPSMVVGPPQRGRTVAVLQDTSDAAGALDACRGAACVVHEATFEEAMEPEAVARGHSTSRMAADFARNCGAERLVLTHFSARYSNSLSEGPTPDPAAQLGEEARRALGEGGPPVVVAQDFMVLRGDRAFEPEAELALRLMPWGRPCAHQGSSGLSKAPCCC